jgi:hypothetical protein
MPNDGDLVDLLADWVPDTAARDAVLAANAQRLYGFPSSWGPSEWAAACARAILHIA